MLEGIIWRRTGGPDKRVVLRVHAPLRIVAHGVYINLNTGKRETEVIAARPMSADRQKLWEISK